MKPHNSTPTCETKEGAPVKTKELQFIIQQQIENIQKVLNAEVASSIVCDSNGKCQYKLTFTYDKQI